MHAVDRRVSFPCAFALRDDAWVCQQCGRRVKATGSFPPVAVCKSQAGLGDMVADGLAAFGITKARVSAIVGGDCGCDGRQAALNKLGESLGLPPGRTASLDTLSTMTGERSRAHATETTDGESGTGGSAV